MYLSERDVKLAEQYRQLRHDQANRERLIVDLNGGRQQRSKVLHSSINMMGKLMVTVGFQLQRKSLQEKRNLPPVGSQGASHG